MKILIGNIKTSFKNLTESIKTFLLLIRVGCSISTAARSAYCIYFYFKSADRHREKWEGL